MLGSRAMDTMDTRDTHARPRHSAGSLVAFARELLHATGLDPAMASDVADVLVDGDLLGHTTHGLQLLAPYLRELDSGAMRKSGEPTLVAQHAASQTWDG